MNKYLNDNNKVFRRTVFNVVFFFTHTNKPSVLVCDSFGYFNPLLVFESKFRL